MTAGVEREGRRAQSSSLCVDGEKEDGERVCMRLCVYLMVTARWVGDGWMETKRRGMRGEERREQEKRTREWERSARRRR